jgi:hypothetical protein
MMSITAPEWLTKRGGELQEGTTGQSWLVVLGGTPQYRLVPVPASGCHACQVTQTVNGKRLDGGGTFPNRDDAIRGGLEDLRKALGW